MNFLLYVTLFKIVFLYIIPIIDCDNDNKIFVCSQNKIQILYDTSNNAKSKLPCLSSPSCFHLKKNSKNNEIIKKPIYKGPEISKLLQSGIQGTIQFSKKNADRDTYKFYENNNSFVEIPFPTKGFKFRAFAPDNFFNLRNLYKISEEFVTSFQTSPIQTGIYYRHFIDTFYYTQDYKFYINIITVENVKFVVSNLSKYFSHFCQNQLSLLPKISGLFHIKHKNFELYFIVKPYIFANVTKSTYGFFYTKGNPDKSSLIFDDGSDLKSCQKELDIRRVFSDGIIISPDEYNNLQTNLEKDTTFLKSLDISDYIFMININPSFKSNNKLSDVPNPDQNDKKTANLDLIMYMGIDNIFQNKKENDQSYYKFHHFNCKFKYQLNQNTKDYQKNFMNFITKELFKSNGK